MSELTQCNYCSHQYTLRRAMKEGKKVTVLPSDFGLGGVREYVHPKNMDMKSLTEKEREPFSVAWFMELPDHCCC